MTVRSAIAHLPGIKDIEFSIPEKFVRFKYLAEKTSIQELIDAINGKYKRFAARLVLKLADPSLKGPKFDKLQERVGLVPGVRAMSWPDDEGIVLITFKSELKTYLPSILKASREVGNPLVDAPAKQANLRL